MRKLKPGHVLFPSAVSCSHFTVLNKNPVIAHNVLHCASVPVGERSISHQGSTPGSPRLFVLGAKLSFLAPEFT